MIIFSTQIKQKVKITPKQFILIPPYKLKPSIKRVLVYSDHECLLFLFKHITNTQDQQPQWAD